MLSVVFQKRIRSAEGTFKVEKEKSMSFTFNSGN